MSLEHITGPEAVVMIAMMLIPAGLFSQWRDHVRHCKDHLNENLYERLLGRMLTMETSFREEIETLEESIKKLPKKDITKELETIKDQVFNVSGKALEKVVELEKKSSTYQKKVDALVSKAGLGL
jgi:Mg2+ and Co2+ transporter CorA